MKILEQIHSPADLKKLTEKQLKALAQEIREEIVRTVSRNGGHLSSNLGIVEATLALHYVFDTPRDRILFDVSHQSYAHKLVTGRYGQFSTLRQKGGISGFSNPAESEYDPLYEGHSGTAVSQALAFAVADALDGKPDYSIAVVGDGAFTNGLSYEALNNCAENRVRLIILLNDNEMSISRNIGGLKSVLGKLRSSVGYFRFKHNVTRVLRKIPLLGRGLLWLGKKIKNFVKRLFLSKNLFENMGLKYIGPVNGNDLKKTISALKEAKEANDRCVVHIYTKKGLGYAPAEAEPTKYHSVDPFDPETGVQGNACESFSCRFGKFLAEYAERDGRVCAITAAMGAGCGLLPFAEKFPKRYFDVGIAEEHAVTFGAGLSAAGKLPVCALYSTFAQRVFDELFQDVSLAKLHFVLALDRCGFVEGDGITHQGLYDVALFSTLDHTQIYAPVTFSELEFCLEKALKGEGLQIVRYPKGGESPYCGWQYTADGGVAYTRGTEKKEKAVITYGRVAQNALACEGEDVGIVRLVKAFPPDTEAIARLTASAKRIVLVEEGILEGGIAQKLSPMFKGKEVSVLAVRGPVLHGSLSELYSSHGLSAEHIAAALKRKVS